MRLGRTVGGERTDRSGVLCSIHRLNSRMSGLHRVQGIDISRCFEYTKAYEKIATVQGQRVLDIGSYRSPFPAFLVQRGFEVSIVDLTPTVGRQRAWTQRALGRPAPLSTYIADATSLPFSDEAFHVVTCISTVEHLTGDGDRRLASEIGRTLTQGGHCFISVPYAFVAKEGTWGRWFQRWFDMATARERLVGPSGLALIAHGWLMGGRVGQMADLWYALPRLLRHALSWSHILLFPRAFEIDSPSQSDARVLWLFLRK